MTMLLIVYESLVTVMIILRDEIIFIAPSGHYSFFIIYELPTDRSYTISAILMAVQVRRRAGDKKVNEFLLVQSKCFLERC